MGSSHDSRYWTCPHCFVVLDWDNQRGAIMAHRCEAVRQIIEESLGGKPARHLDNALAIMRPRKPCTQTKPDQEELTEMDIKKAIKIVVAGEFEDAAAVFNQNPTADRWERLQNAMWARQAVTSDDSMAKAMEQLPGIGIGHWIKSLRRIHEGK